MTTLKKQTNAGDPTFDFTGTWRNQRESEMTLVMASDGSISGTYRTEVGGGLQSSIVGKARGDQIVFFVDWVPHSMTTWVGQLLTDKNGKESIETAWLNSRDVSLADEPQAGWSGIRTGGDQFTKSK